MAVGPFGMIRHELEQMQQEMEKEMKLRSGHVSQFVSLEMETVEKYLYPAALILSARAMGLRSRRVQSVASVVQFINLATHTHRAFCQDLAFPVLVGDYLYTKFFSYLCDHDALQWLAPLSQAICDIHDGGILRHEARSLGLVSAVDRLKIVAKEYASLLAESCAIGAQLAGATDRSIEALREFGLNLGMAWGVLRESEWGLPVEPYLTKAKESLGSLPERVEKQRLEELVKIVAPASERLVGAAVV